MYAAKIVRVPEQGREICIWAVCANAALVSETLRWCEEGCRDTAVCAELRLTVGLPGSFSGTHLFATISAVLCLCSLPAVQCQCRPGQRSRGSPWQPQHCPCGKPARQIVFAHVPIVKPDSFLDALSICLCPAGLLSSQSGEGLWLQEPMWGRCSANRALGSGSTAFPG